MGGSVSIGQTGRPTVFPKEDFDAASSAENVKNAITGFGTDESALIKVFASHSNLQRQEIASVFKQSYGKDLQEELKDECGGDFEAVLIALTTPTRLYEAQLLRNAMAGAGTDENVLIEVLGTKSNVEIKELREIYQEEYREDDRKLEVDIENETSGDFRCLLLSLLNGNREEIPADEDVATEDATRLHEAGEARFGTDEAEFNRVLCLRSYDHLQLVLSKYEEMFGESLEDVVNNETSGSIQDGYLTILKFVRDSKTYFAGLLYKSMKGIGTDDDQLIRTIVTRSEIDLADIQDKFGELYEQSLEDFVKDDLGGNYEKIILCLLNPSSA